MSVDLRSCDPACTQCVRQYIKKHRVGKGQSFKIPCTGIPLKYVPDSVLAKVEGDPELAIALLDPVTWAAKFLDWHCLDPDGKIWKRKHDEGSLKDLPPYDEERAKAGKSIFHRPYQAAMLRCSSKHKVFRIGRQAGKTESICISILFAIFTHENYTVEVLAPYQSQIDLIFSRLNQLINNSPLARNSIARSVKAPNYILELFNGSTVRGFTAASRSGGDAGSARGQSAKYLVFDEADMLNQSDIDAALAVIINHPDAQVWMASTPTGKRQSFYNTCHAADFKEFHFPSYVNPNWTHQHEELFRSRLSSMGYTHEIDAQFGEQEEGVYQAKFVDAAQQDFEYHQFKWIPGWTYTIGVDWNDVKAGCVITVVGKNPGDGRCYLVDKAIVSRDQWTQTAACQKIVEYNRLWHPSWIYIDWGYGATQGEILQLEGHNARKDKRRGPTHPDARLAHIVKYYKFGSTVEVRDPFTKQPVDKPAKAFLVENSVRFFESVSFHYPRSDVELTKQLLGYRIKRVSQSGVPVYEQGDDTANGDHRLDSLNLALVPFALEQSIFGAPKYTVDIAVVPQRLGETPSSAPRAAPHDPPSLGRANPQPDGRGRPMASHVQGKNGPPRIWSWPGWGHDAPPPTSSRRALTPSRRTVPRPKRSNI